MYVVDPCIHNAITYGTVAKPYEDHPAALVQSLRLLLKRAGNLGVGLECMCQHRASVAQCTALRLHVGFLAFDSSREAYSLFMYVCVGILHGVARLFHQCCSSHVI